MPIYNNLQPISWRPTPEAAKRRLFGGMSFSSVLDVGTGHGGVFDVDFWNNVHHKEACDIFSIKPLPQGWTTTLGVNATELTKWYSANSFDFVQCTEVLEHIEDSDAVLYQLLLVAKKAVFITSCDEIHHQGPEQKALEAINPCQRYIRQPSVQTLLELGFEVRVEDNEYRQLIAWKIK